MKILTIVTTKFDISGITNSVMNYYRYMDKSDMKIDFLVPNKVSNRLRDEIESNGGRIFELLMRNKNPFLYIKQLEKIIRKGGYDIVHAHGNSSTLAVEMYAAKRAGAKVRIAHSRNTTCKYLTLDKLLRPIFNKTYTHGFACGVEAGKWLFEANPFTVITNGNDIDKFAFDEKTRNDFRQKYNLQDKKVIGHVGSFNYQKNHEFLINTFYELLKFDSNCVLVLVGEGDLKPSIEQKVVELGMEDKVIFTGKSFEVEKLLQAMDIMVLPSRYEGLPNVVVEWQIACLPSLVSDKVTSEAKLTDLVEFESLDKTPKDWAYKINKIEIINRSTISEEVQRGITKAGFNVKQNAIDLKNIYIKLIKS